MFFSELKKETQWISDIDEFFEFDMSGNALCAIFSVDNPTDPMFINSGRSVCLDIFNEQHQFQDDLWIPYDEATEEQISATKCMRYIVLTN